MKKYILTLSAVLLASTAFAQIPFQPTEIVTLTAGVVNSSGDSGFSQTIILNEGDGLAVINIGKEENIDNSGTTVTVEAMISINSSSIIFPLAYFSGTATLIPFDSPSIITGPAEVRLRVSPGTDSRAFGFATLAFFKANATAAPSLTPQNTIVIPEDATGTLQIILESSNDLINWTAALPGNYSAETAQRFFRVRAVLQ